MIRRLALPRGVVVLPSRTLVDLATEAWRLPPACLRYIPNGIDVARFACPPTRGRGDPVIGTVAGLRAEKNIARLLRAFARVAAETAARLVIVGDGPERPALTALAAALGLGDRVAFAGQRDDTPALYAGFDIFALSSDTEQMPLSVIEAMAAALPVAATDVGDVRAMLAAENAPFVGPPDDAALARSLAALLRDPGLCARLGEANRIRAGREFDQAALFAAWGAVWAGTAPPA
jgi:glycosyltransferase involved in cell wall biosynthesis